MVSSMHLDEEQIQRVVHRELTPPAAAAASAHLGDCPECRARVAEAELEETWVQERLRQLDHPLPRVTAAEIARHAGGGARDWGRWAAGTALLLAIGGAAYAAPGSPLPALIDTLIARVERTPPTSSPEPAPPEQSDGSRGIAVPPGDHLVIAFPAHQPGGVATVWLTDDTEVVVRVASGAVSFTSDVDRLAIEHADSAVGLEIRIPRDAPRVEIRVGTRTVFTSRASRVITDGRRDQEGRYLVPLRSPRR
jgi:hypothetical protein